MSFWSSLLHPKSRESVALIDIGAGSLAGAYAHYPEGQPPEIWYTKRVPIVPHEGEAKEDAMFRALGVLGEGLIKEGSPLLARATGSGRVDTVLVSVDAPWQETTIRTERYEEKIPFTFTRTLVNEALRKGDTEVPGKLLVDESVIGTVLNGYPTHEPYGKRVHRASILILASHIEKEVARRISTMLRDLYHTRTILPIAGSSLRYQAIRAAFPHERNALIVDATGPEVAIALVREAFLVAVYEKASADAGSPEWMKGVTDAFAEIAKTYPLPRTIFLVAREPEVAQLRSTLDAAHLGALWLSEDPPRIVCLLASHVLGTMQFKATTPPDLPVLLMALFWKHHDDL